MGRNHGMISRPMRRAAATLVAVVATAVATGCDSKKKERAPDPAPPTPAVTTQPAPAAASRPTTQELTSGKRKSLVLGSFPLRMDVPQSWTLSTIGSGTFLSGDTPNGDVRIQLAKQGGQVMRADSVTAMEQRAMEKAKAKPEVLEIVPLRAIGGTAKAMERKDFTRDMPVTRDDGKVERVDRVDWAVNVFVPEDKDYGIDVLMMKLPLDQYQKDREFLDGILRTLRYDATGGALD